MLQAHGWKVSIAPCTTNYMYSCIILVEVGNNVLINAYNCSKIFCRIVLCTIRFDIYSDKKIVYKYKNKIKVDGQNKKN